MTTVSPTRFADPYEFWTHSDETEPTGLKCELRTFEARYNSKGDQVPLEVGTRESLEPPTRGDESALILTRYYDEQSKLTDTELLVKSPLLNKILKRVIAKYPGVNLEAHEIVISELPRCLFHYREELLSYGKTLLDNLAVQHLILLLNYMWQTLHIQLMTYQSLMESDDRVHSLLFDNLWMAFKPSCLVYYSTPESSQVLRFKSMDIERRDGKNFRWVISAEEINHDGKEFGYTRIDTCIHSYEGYVSLERLSIYPLEFAQDAERIENQCVSKGKKFVSLRGLHHRKYEGTAKALAPMRKRSLFNEEDEYPLHTTTIEGRVMIDGANFALMYPSMKARFRYSSQPIGPNDHERFADHDFIICSPWVPGFSFAKKRWCYFDVDCISDIEFNRTAFDQLRLPEEEKKMIHSLVQVHGDEKSHFDDIIEGKGKGIVFLLHGTPGVGKTLTAESVADHVGRPLYTINCGELGVDMKFVEDYLTDNLKLAACWNAIVLFDEADVFLEQRSVSDLKRNGLVAIFLHLLEYYEGILFLTTNRIDKFDVAFKSRIHLAIKYHPLSFESRRDIWRLFLDKANASGNVDLMDEASLDTLAAENINGRQIKNVVRTAHALAMASDESLNFSQIEISLKAMMLFEAHITEDIEAERSSSSAGGKLSRKRRRDD